jgi:hypothetical protein
MLSKFEKEEIKTFEIVYYMNISGVKKKAATL